MTINEELNEYPPFIRKKKKKKKEEKWVACKRWGSLHFPIFLGKRRGRNNDMAAIKYFLIVLKEKRGDK